MYLVRHLKEQARTLRAFLAVSLAVSLAAMLFVNRHDEAKLRERELYVVTATLWGISELVYESERLSGSLLSYRHGTSNKGQVETRFDILWSRVDSFGSASDVQMQTFAGVLTDYREFLWAEEAHIFSAGAIPADTLDRQRDQLSELARNARVVWSLAMARDQTGISSEKRQGISRAKLSEGAVEALIAVLILFVLIEIFLANRGQAREMRLHAAALEANEAKSRFLANVSHEIRTPLNGILGMASELSDARMSDDQAECVRIIEESGGILLNTINDVLDLAKVEAGEFDVETRPFDLTRVLESAITLYSAKAREKGLTLTLKVRENLPRIVQGDGRRLQQVLNNLIANAVKFTESGAVTVQALPSSTGQEIVISVRDTGPGIARDARDKIFEPFSQADSSVTRKHGGTGLGLAISRQLCEAMGGVLSLVSRPGRGSTFYCQLPLPGVAGAAIEPAGVDDERPPDLSHWHILVADDNATNRLILERFLKPTGVRITMAINGAEALEAASETSFDAILMDIQMPRMDGVAATHAIRALEKERGRRPVPIHGVTANAMTHQVEEYLAAGMDGVLSKPLSKQALMKVLHQENRRACAA